jgi:hypothetical protein
MTSAKMAALRGCHNGMYIKLTSAEMAMSKWHRGQSDICQNGRRRYQTAKMTPTVAGVSYPPAG